MLPGQSLLPSVNGAKIDNGSRRVSIWPTFFTTFVLACVIPPVIESIRLTQDPTVRYHIGVVGYASLLAPVCILACHIWLVRLGSPKRSPVLVATLVPCVIFFWVGTVHSKAGKAVSSVLQTRDCTDDNLKLTLQHSWYAAAEFYEGLVNKSAASRGISFVDGLKMWRLQQFEAYSHGIGTANDRFGEYRKDWEFLRSMEEAHLCAGWCWFSRPIWTFQEVHDACSFTAAAVLNHQVGSIAPKLVMYSQVLIVASVLFIVVAGKELENRGIDWTK
eukprot:TRINITY_DN17084_c0_g1_i1.p1 TRINITY_DN17084_c0_g1~~TRINITY_DN17084_c0_g1_i1.p1  ORF type:complete len:305 (+),score=37.88 TRINITY_DN17084_c0_g1_i1:92-916(+)